MNTLEIREGLEKLGYERNIGMYDNSDGIYLRTFGFTYGQFSNEYLKTGAIDCGANIPLFLAIAAIREDEFDGQYFVADSDLSGCWGDTIGNLHDFTIKKGAFFVWERYITYSFYFHGEYHKATTEELTNYFKDK